MMNIILLSGGSGKRLWPLSNEIRSKQFIKIFHKEDGSLESMIQRFYRLVKENDKDANIVVATSKNQVSTINNQLNEKVDISLEPCRKDTFPAIALACAYLKDINGLDENEGIIVCPVDPYVEKDYFIALNNLYKRVLKSDSNLVLMGMEPTYPSEKYGYIIPQDKKDISKVSMFKEKPSEEVAKKYISEGALWNGGVFGFKLGYVLKKAHELIDFKDYNDLFNKYEALNKISFDYAIVEKEKNIEVMRFNGGWKDLGTWNTLTEAMDSNSIGKAIFNDNCFNTHIINELNIPILCMGLKDSVIALSSDGLLVSDKKESSYIKPYVDKLENRVMYAEKSWGSYRVLDVEENSITIKVTLNKGHMMSYHSHDYRDEIWTITKGSGRTIVDGMENKADVGDVITMARGCKHTIIADSDLELIEVQLGDNINVTDKHKYEFE